MATFFGRPVSEFLRDVGISAAQGAAWGALIGYREARHDGSDHALAHSMRTAGGWALTDAIVEGGLGILTPGLREGSVMRSTLVSAAVGGASGFVEGYSEAKYEHSDHVFGHAMTRAAQGAVIDAATESLTENLFPGLRNARRE